MAIPKIRNLIEARVKDTGDTMTGRLTQTINGNPYYGLSDGTNNWYFQAIKADNASYIGPTSSKALKIDVNGNSSIRGSLLIEKDLSLLTGDDDRYIVWDYSNNASLAGASWRIGMQGTGSNDANYFVIQTTGASTGASETFTNAIRIGMNSKDVLLSSTTNSTSKTTGALVVSGGAAINSTLTVGGNIVPDEAGGANVGTGSLPFLQTVARNHYLYDTNNVQTGRLYTGKVGTTSEVGQAYITIGNSKASGTANNAKGFVVLYGDQTYYSQIVPANGLTAHRTITLPNASGTVALTSNLSSYLPLSGGTLTGNVSFNSTINSLMSFFSENVTSGTTAGSRKGFLIFGTTYGNDAAYLKTAGKLTLGDPGPQIMFNTSNTRTSGQRISLIYTDHDTIASGNSLSLVSSETNAWFISPSMKVLTTLNNTGNYQQNGISGRLASITSSAPSLTTANKILWAW